MMMRRRRRRKRKKLMVSSENNLFCYPTALHRVQKKAQNKYKYHAVFVLWTGRQVFPQHVSDELD